MARHNRNWQDGNYAVVLDEKLVRMLTQLEKNKEKASNKALREGAKVMAGHVEKHTPVGPEPRKPDKYGPYTPYSTTRLKNDVKYQKVDDSYIVGYGKDTHWRAVFVNNGTIHIRPQRFFERAVKSGSKDTIDKIREIALTEMLKAGLK